MLLCYKCYMKRYAIDMWDAISFDHDNIVKYICDDCGLTGIYIREIPDKK